MAGPNNHSDEDYDSASDEDFNPNAQAANNGYLNSSDDERLSSKGHRKSSEEAEDIGFENSGDEATISKGRRKKRKLDDLERVDDDGGEGGLIKTRSQRRQENQKKKPLTNTSTTLVDVDALWAQMSAAGKANDDKQVVPGLNSSLHNDKPSQEKPAASIAEHRLKPSTPATDQSGIGGTASISNNITIKRTYEFAGQVMKEERTVLADSAEAQLYQEEQLKKSQASDSRTPRKPNVRRPMKRKSIFETTTTLSETDPSKGGLKLNTLEKSKLDWARHVDNEGLSEELDEHRKGKDTYLGRMDFLGRMDAKREDEIKTSTHK